VSDAQRAFFTALIPFCLLMLIVVAVLCLLAWRMKKSLDKTDAEKQRKQSDEVKR
jgi:hypothetical protein